MSETLSFLCPAKCAKFPRPKLRPNFRYKSTGSIRRMWILIMDYLDSFTIMKLRVINRLLYTLTWEPEVWKSVLQHQYLKNDTKRCNLNRMFSFTVEKNRLTMRKCQYLFWSKVEDLRCIYFEVSEREFRECKEVTLDELMQENSDYGTICYGLRKFGCGECGGLYEDLYHFKSLMCNLCGKCLRMSKYRRINVQEACLMYGVSYEQFIKMKIVGENRRVKEDMGKRNSSKEVEYFEILVKEKVRLYKLLNYQILVKQNGKKLQRRNTELDSTCKYTRQELKSKQGSKFPLFQPFTSK